MTSFDEVDAAPLRIASVVMHTSPVASPGWGDAGGMNVVVLEQTRRLARLGHDVELITRRTAAAEPERVEIEPGLTLRTVVAGPVAPVAKGEHEGLVDAFAEGLGSLSTFDVVHSHHWFSGMAALPAAQAAGVAHVQSFHSIAVPADSPDTAGERAESPGRLDGEAWLATQSDRVVAISHSEAQTAMGRLGANPAAVTTVFPGVDTAVFSPAQHPKRLPGHIVVAGRLHPVKGIDLAVEALAGVPEAIRPVLVVAGQQSVETASYATALRARTHQLGLDRWVHFAGSFTRAELAELFRTARLVLIPSHSETYGLVALEAAASGVPVIANASGGLREAVVAGRTGIVLTTSEPRAWAEALTELLENPERAERLGAAALDRARTLTWEHSAAELVNAYETTIGRFRGR